MGVMIDLEDKWLKRLQEGDLAAFSFLFDRYNRLLYAIAYRYLKSRVEAEDAVQYTFMKVWEQRCSLDFNGGVRSLLFTILKHYALNELRHQQIVWEKHEEMIRAGEKEEEDFLVMLEKKEFSRYLHQAIAQLPPQKREICKLKINRGLSNQEIAEEMGITVPTVKSHYTQAIKMLRETISKFIFWLVYLLFHS